MSISKLNKLLKKQVDKPSQKKTYSPKQADKSTYKDDEKPKRSFTCEQSSEYSDKTIVITNSYGQLTNFNKSDVEKIAEALTYFDEEANQFKIGILRSLKYAFAAKRNRSVSKYMWSVIKKNGCDSLDEHIDKLQKTLKSLKYRIYVCLLNSRCYFPTGLLEMVQETIPGTSIVDLREPPSNPINLRWYKNPPEMRYYQKEMVDLGIQSERGVFEAAVGSGKTLTAAYLIKEISAKTLIVVPSTKLKDQIYTEMWRAFGKSKVQIVESSHIKKKSKLKDIRIMTVQTLASLQKQKELSKVTADIDVLILDEFHHAGSVSYGNLLNEIENIYYRFGFTGTFTRNDSKLLDLWGFLSKRLYHYPAYKATEEGYLTEVDYFVYNLQGNAAQNYQKEYAANYCLSKDKYNKVIYPEELLSWIRNLTTKVIPEDEQVLILVDQKEKAGEVIHKFLLDFGIENTYISGDNKSSETNEAIEAFNNKEIRVLVATGVLGEGIDLKSTQHLVLAGGGKSEIKLVQAIGRAVRLYPNKPKSFVYDCNFEGTKYLEKHTGIRQDIFANHFSGRIVHH